MMEYSSEVLEQLRACEIEILDVIVEFCDRNQLRYSLGYGTLIGAVRHKGFIPWDDDIDILMPRKDYEFLRSKWDNPNYYIHDFYKDIEFTNNFIKIRKKHTTFCSEKGDNKHMSGIFVDIFPADRVPDIRILQLYQFFLFAVNLLFTRGFPSGHGGALGFAERLLLKLPRKSQIKLRNYSDKAKRKWNDTNKGQYVNGSTIIESRVYYPDYMFKDFIEVEFCGKKYKSVKCFDEFLTIMYGDYMQLPPEDERIWSHRPDILSFDKDYDELVEEKKCIT